MLNDLRRLSSKYFAHISVLFFLLFATILCLRAVHKAKVEYGDKWQFSVYTDNPFQIPIATRLQQSLHQQMQSQGITGDEGAIIEAMTIGYKAELPKRIKEQFARAGVSHILALSGFHVGIIYIILQLVFLSRIVLYRWQWITQILTILMLWAYAFLAGMSPSLVRAVIMCTIFTISKLHTYKLLSLRALVIAAIIMFLIQPLLIFHVGFQLSYLSMLGIYLIGIPLCKLYTGYTFIDRTVWSTIIITLTCTLFTLPIVAYNFGQIPVLSIITNLIFLPLVYILFILMFLWIITFGMPLIGSYMLSISHRLLLVVKYVGDLPCSIIEFKPTIPAIILYYCILGIIVVVALRKQKANSLHYS